MKVIKNNSVTNGTRYDIGFLRENVMEPKYELRNILDTAGKLTVFPARQPVPEELGL